MKARLTKGALLLALSALAIMGVSPAGATSAYHMNGQGTITITPGTAGGGLPACLPVVLQGDCTTTDTPFSWGDLTVQGAGLLQNIQIGGQYDCKSEGTVGGTPFLSRIRGNTTNFELTFNFQCTKASGIGSNFINGWFSNVNGTTTSGSPYHSVAGHPHPTPVAAGAFAFKGYFVTSDIHPYSINAGNGDAMSCGGGFAPSAFNGLKIKTAAFVGACTAAE